MTKDWKQSSNAKGWESKPEHMAGRPYIPILCSRGEE